MDTIVVSKLFMKRMRVECAKYIVYANDKQPIPCIRDLRECMDMVKWYPMPEEIQLFWSVADILNGKRGN